MKLLSGIVVCLFIALTGKVFAQNQPGKLWALSRGGITWDITRTRALPHADNIEMDGQQVAVIVDYEVDQERHVSVTRKVIFPQLREFIKVRDPEYLNFRAYLQDDYTDGVLPVITFRKRRFQPGQVDSVHINGKLELFHRAEDGIRVKREFFPSMKERAFVEKWTLTNVSDSVKEGYAGNSLRMDEEKGVYGVYHRQIRSDAPQTFRLLPGQEITFGVYFTASLESEAIPPMDYARFEQERNRFIDTLSSGLILETPSALLNTLFKFSKYRAAESIYQSSMGLVHSPGGGRYYAGIWANDQGEYTAPLFPWLGYQTAMEAARNIYGTFLKNIPAPGKSISSSFEMNGEMPCCGTDRGDAAMIANGLSLFLLTSGNKEDAVKFWPLLEWSLSYCDSMKNKDGVIDSKSDELEGRLPSGTANLSTSCLYYGALKSVEMLAATTGKPVNLAASYHRKAVALRAAIEKYFGARVEGFDTYRYYTENTTLRSWICLPLVEGINERKQGTNEALFGKLWTADGLLSEDSPDTTIKKIFWDRSTLFALRGAFKSGASDRAESRLNEFSENRLLGYRTPYVVEAWPEGEMAHLSGESALYCRIYTEGLLAMEPKGFKAFSLAPFLPSNWDSVRLSRIRSFGSSFDVEVKKAGSYLSVEVFQDQQQIFKRRIKPGQEIIVNLH